MAIQNVKSIPKQPQPNKDLTHSVWPTGNCPRWRGYLSGARCRFAYGPTDPIATHFLLLQEIQVGYDFTFLIQAHPVSPGQNPESCKTVAPAAAAPAHTHTRLLSLLAPLKSQLSTFPFPYWYTAVTTRVYLK